MPACKQISLLAIFRFLSFFSEKGALMKRLTISLSIAAAVLTAACAPTQNSRGTGEVVEDASITTRVKTKIAQMAGVSEAASINVDTYKNVVSLAGWVDSPEQARIALQAAQSVPGVQGVRNNLEIKPRVSGTTSGR
jgi:hyperosmotically inducible protein